MLCNLGFIFVGLIFLAAGVRAIYTGKVNWRHVGQVRREEDPLVFWFPLIIFMLLGATLAIVGIRELFLSL